MKHGTLWVVSFVLASERNGEVVDMILTLIGIFDEDTIKTKIRTCPMSLARSLRKRLCGTRYIEKEKPSYSVTVLLIPFIIGRPS